MTREPATTEALYQEIDRLRQHIASLEQTVAQLTDELDAVRQTSTVSPSTDTQIPYHHLFEQIPIPLVIFRPDGLLVAINHCNEQLLHISDKRAIGRYNIFHDPEARQKGFAESAALALAGETHRMFPASFDTARVKESGIPPHKIIWTETTHFPIRDEHGTVQFIGEINRNIADHTLTLEEARVFHALTENAPEGIAVLDMDGKIMYANVACRTLLSHHPHLVGEQVSEICLMTPEEARSILQQTCEHGTAVSQADLLNSDAQRVPMQLSTFLIRDAKGQPRYISLIMHDISEQFQMEASLESAFKQSQTLMRELLDNSPAAIFARDTRGRFLVANQIYTALVELAQTQIIGRTVHELFSPTQASLIHRTDRQVIETGQQVDTDELSYHTGETRTYLGIKFPLYDANGTLYAIGGIATDITERKRAEEALRQSEERFRAIFENAGIGITFTDQEGMLLASNPTFQRMVGYPAEELRQMSIQHLTHSADISAEDALMAELLAGMRTSYQLEKRYIRRDDTTIWVRVTCSIAWSQENVSQFWIAMVEDISEQKETDRALTAAYNDLSELNRYVSRSRDLLRTLFDGLDDGLVLLDSQGTVQAANQAVASLLSHSLEKLVGQSWEHLCQHAQPAFPGTLALQTLRDGFARRRRERATSSNGQIRILDMQTLPLLGSDQTVDRIILHMVDMTEHLQLEALAAQSEQFAASGRLAAIVAHEINTPLQAIRNLLFLAGQADDSRRGTYLQLVREEIDRITGIVRQLLDLYRPDNSTLAPLDINQLVERVLMLAGGILAQHHIGVERTLAPDLPLFWGRIDQLTQVLLNLVVNAVDAMPEGGRLSMRTGSRKADLTATRDDQEEPPEEELFVEIIDTGIGMPPDMHQRVFEPFVTTKTHGSGLGLAISQKIIKQHRGKITVQSTPGQGSTFVVILPVAHENILDLEAEA